MWCIHSHHPRHGWIGKVGILQVELSIRVVETLVFKKWWEISNHVVYNFLRKIVYWWRLEASVRSSSSQNRNSPMNNICLCSSVKIFCHLTVISTDQTISHQWRQFHLLSRIFMLTDYKLPSQSLNLKAHRSSWPSKW